MIHSKTAVRAKTPLVYVVRSTSVGQRHISGLSKPEIQKAVLGAEQPVLPGQRRMKEGSRGLRQKSAGKRAHTARQGRNSMRTQSSEWRPFASYPNNELRAVDFIDEANVDRALEILWKRVPFVIADALTLIMPAERVNVLREHHLDFTESKLLDRASLPPAELAGLGRKNGV